nr:FIST N-terminal domain-containing protein [Solemya elarraichensis gill symbiont]
MEFSLHRYTVESKWDRAFDSTLDSPQTLVVVFVTPRPGEELCSELAGIHVSFPNSVVIGCSSSGEIYGEVLSDDSIIAAVIHFADTRLKLVHCEITDAVQSYDVGTSVAEQLLAPDLAAVFTLTDGLKVNGSAYVEGLNHILPDDAIITGGLAGDCDQFERTWLLYDGQCHSGGFIW